MKTRCKKKTLCANRGSKSGREDLNLRHPAPKTGALTGLRYAPNFERGCNVGYDRLFVKLSLL